MKKGKGSNAQDGRWRENTGPPVPLASVDENWVVCSGGEGATKNTEFKARAERELKRRKKRGGQ